MPSSLRVTQALLQQIPKDFQGEIGDLGAGFGVLAWRIARHCPAATVTGYESSPIPWIVAKCLFRRSNLVFVKKDFLDSPLGKYDLIVCYLCPKIMQQLKPKFEAELQDTLVITHTFAIRDKSWDSRVLVADMYQTPIYLYRYFFQK